MSSSTATRSVDTARESIAPWWHTALVLVLLAVGSVASWYQHGLPNAHVPGISSRLSSYFTVLVQEWCVVLLIWLALKRGGLRITSLVSRRWQSLGAFFRDLGLAAGFFIVTGPLIGTLIHLFSLDAAGNFANIVPKTGFELAVWLGLAATAGFCEELNFRGYLTRQFSAWTGSSIIAVFLQGVVFGLSHGYYGKAMVVIMLHGWLLGLLASWRRSLLPGILAHGLQDGIGGMVAFFA
jgi:CAAX protease family protein